MNASAVGEGTDDRLSELRRKHQERAEKIEGVHVHHDRSSGPPMGLSIVSSRRRPSRHFLYLTSLRSTDEGRCLANLERINEGNDQG